MELIRFSSSRMYYSQRFRWACPILRHGFLWASMDDFYIFFSLVCFTSTYGFDDGYSMFHRCLSVPNVAWMVTFTFVCVSVVISRDI